MPNDNKWTFRPSAGPEQLSAGLCTILAHEGGEGPRIVGVVKAADAERIVNAVNGVQELAVAYGKLTDAVRERTAPRGWDAITADNPSTSPDSAQRLSAAFKRGCGAAQ